MAEYTGIRAPTFDGKNYEIFKELLTIEELLPWTSR